MDITSEEYQVFYKVLCRAVAQKYYNGNKKKYYSEDSPQLWKSFDENEFLESLGGEKAQSIMYFYRKASLLNPETARNGKVDNEALLKGLEYIGIKLPATESNKQMTRGKKLRILFGVFKETYTKEIALLRSDHSHDVASEADTSDNKSFHTASKIIKHYFQLLANKKYEDAWEILHPGFRTRHFRDDFQHFSDLHEAVSNFEVLWTFEHVQIDDTIELKVVLKYRAMVIPGAGLASFSLWPVSRMDKFYELLKQLRMTMKDLGFNGFENVRLAQLFEDTASIQIAKSSDVPFKSIRAAFAKHGFVKKYKIYSCVIRVLGDEMKNSIYMSIAKTYKEDELYI